MRGLAVAGMSAVGLALALYGLAVVVCVTAALIIGYASLRAPWLRSLRTAAWLSVALAAVAEIVAVLLVWGPGLPFETLTQLYQAALVIAASASLYPIVMLVTGGFAERGL